MKHRVVLVIEDDPDFAEGLRISLEYFGFFVLVAEDGADGIKKADILKPDCIILDILLPKRDGYSIFLDLKNNHRTRDIPVIVVTSLLKLEGYPGADLLMQRDDVAAYIEKPVDPTMLIETVSGLIEKSKK